MKKKSKKSLNTNKNFFEKVYEITRMIPPGRVTTYGAIAKAIGIKSSARLVGIALKYSLRLNEYIPAHRVVNRNGILTGKHSFGSPDLMQQLLENEGIKIENNKVVNFKKIFWEPPTNFF